MARNLRARARYRFWLMPSVTVLLLASTAAGQAAAAAGGTRPPPPTDIENITEGYHQGGVLRVTVFTDAKTRLDRQAVVRLHSDNPLGTIYQTTKGNSETTFLGLSVGKYDLEISAVGYLTTRKQVDVAGLTDTLQVDVSIQRDATAINLDAAGTADALMPSGASKSASKGIAALKSGNLKEARKQLQSAYRAVPESGRVNFLLGYLFFEQKNYDQAQSYLAHSITLDPHNSQVLALLGRMQLLRGQYDQARTTLEQAIAAAPDDWMPHNLLAGVYLKQKEYAKAQVEARLAIDKGKADAGAAQLVLGQALADLGHPAEGIQTLQSFLQATSTSPQAQQVRDFIAELQRRGPAPASEVASSGIQITTAASDADPLVDTSEPELSVAWQPPGVDEAKPAVAAGVACPSEQVMQSSGERVEQLVDSVGRFAAIEDLLHERLDTLGNPTSRETRKFDYAAYISQPQPDVLLVDEFRTERFGLDTLPDQIVTSGFPALALIFHPSMRVNYDMTCEGLGQWHGEATWLVHFRQRDDKPSRIQDYVVGKNTYPIRLKGRAWITADKFQIVRIESELVSPLKGIGFLTEHQIAEYGPVKFEKKNVELWLPKSAEVYLDFHRHRYFRRHSFDKYMLFSVDSTDQVKEAKHDPHGPGSTSPRKRKYVHA